MLDGLTGWHLLILAGVMLLLFGARRLPDAARSLGRSARILRSEVREFSKDGDSTTASSPSPPESGLAPGAGPADAPVAGSEGVVGSPGTNTRSRTE
jgi:sec-independent protein translocase protein TatA